MDLSSKEGTFSEYKSPGITDALEDAYSSILNILKGETQHPIVSMYIEWMAKRPRGNRDKMAYEYTLIENFSLPIFPGDKHLAGILQQSLLRDMASFNISMNEVLILSEVLFSVVILRTYLGRKPCDDSQIFCLALSLSAEKQDRLAPDDVLLEAKKGRISRRPTPHDRVMATTPWAAVVQGLKVVNGLQIQPDHTAHIDPRDFFSAVNSDGEPYTFFQTTYTGLTGGAPYVRKIIAPTLRTPIPSNQPRPKPRALSQATHRVILPGPNFSEAEKTNNVVDEEHSGKRKSEPLVQTNNGQPVLRRSKRVKVTANYV